MLENQFGTSRIKSLNSVSYYHYKKINNNLRNKKKTIFNYTYLLHVKHLFYQVVNKK